MLLAITKKNLDTLFYFLAASSCQQQPVFVNGSTWRKLADCGLWTDMATICLVQLCPVEDWLGGLGIWPRDSPR